MIGKAKRPTQANSAKKRDEFMPDTLVKPVTIADRYAARREDNGGMALCYQCDDKKGESVRVALALIQGKWKIGILFSLQEEPVRLSQLLRRFPAASKKMLTQSLREMERDGLIVRTDLSGRLKHVEYSLSDRSGAIRQLINTLTEWGSRYAASIHNLEANRISPDNAGLHSKDSLSSTLRSKSLFLGLR